MARHNIIAGERVGRRSPIKLTAEQRDTLTVERTITIDEEVVWPLASTIPIFDEAYVDEGGTPIWGPGPYLKVPNRFDATYGEQVLVNRVFCPYGYPPARLRVSHRSVYVAIARVEIVRESETWLWRITLMAEDADA